MNQSYPTTDSTLDRPAVEPITDTLTTKDRDDFQHLHTAIVRTIGQFKQLGMMLKEVRDRRLYREQFVTFEAYVNSLGLGRQRSYALIDNADVAASVSEISDIEVERESHAAALADVRSASGRKS